MCRWYSEKFLKGHWDKEECGSEWQKYKDCLSVSLLLFISVIWNYKFSTDIFDYKN